MSFAFDYEPESDYPEYEPEAILRRPRPGARPAGPQGVGYRPQPQASYVTKAELQAVTDRIDRDAAATRTGLQQLGSRIDAVNAAHTRDMARLRQEFRQQSELGMLLPLLMRPKTVQLATDVDTIKAGQKVVVESGDTMTMLLPLMLMGGGLGGSDSSGRGGGFGDNPMTLAMMAMAFSR